MSQIIRTQARIERISGITADAVVNTFHHVEDSDGPVAAAAAAALIQADLGVFYQAIDGFLSNVLAPLVTFKSYTLSDPEPRAPILTGGVALTLNAGSPLPAEVAFCLSYRAAEESGVPVARTRGRIYLGPLTTGILSTTVAGEIRPSAANAASIRAAGVALAQQPVGDPEWVVWSPTSLTARPIIEVSTDDAFDTQRRRGAKPTLRTRSLV